MFTILMLIIGGGLFAVGMSVLKRGNALKQVCTVQTSGVVIRIDESVATETYIDHDEKDVRRREKTRQSTWYHSVFEYTVGAETYTPTARTASGKPDFAVGDRVSIFYNPEKPEEYYVAEDTGSEWLGKFGVIAGSVIAVGGILVLFL